MNFYFIFLILFWQVNSGGFISVQNYDVSSFSVKTKFEYILYGWACFFGFLGLILVIVKVIFYIRQPTYLIVYNARVERVLIFILQIIALPFGSSIFKVMRMLLFFLIKGNNNNNINNIFLCPMFCLYHFALGLKPFMPAENSVKILPLGIRCCFKIN